MRGAILALWIACTVAADGATPWAYQPVTSPDVPNVADAAWPRGEIDRFLMKEWEARGITPSGDADRATLARRLSFALHGLPPDPKDLEALVCDTTPVALDRWVDSLLESPRFGEHFGRHWLDVARFGQSLTLRGFVFEEAWRYRDYVIDAFNRDLPYDRFVEEQLAGDLMAADTLEERQRGLIATTFLALGNTNLEEQNKRLLAMDVIDEQLDTLGKAFFGQTLGCARCHDHKFDPIPMRDYYALAAIFKGCRQLEHANVSKWLEQPLPLDPAEEARVAEGERAIAAIETDLKAARASATASTTNPRQPAVVAAASLPGVVVDSSAARAVGSWKPSTHFPRYIGDGYLHDNREGKGEKTLTFEPATLPPGDYDVRFAYIPGDGRDRTVPVTVFHAQGETELKIDQSVEPVIDGRWVSLGRFRIEAAGFGHVLVGTTGTTGHVTADAVQFLPVAQADAETAGARAAESAAGAGAAGRASADARIKELEARLKALQAATPKRPMVMTVVETGTPADLPIHRRGSVDALGEAVPRGVLSAVTTVPAPAMPSGQSGRRQLAEWATHPDHPLTARVMVNRVWLWLFGEGLVRTPDNFGTTGEPPTHPELLDFLATRFRQDGWSVKRLVRTLVLSRAWQLRSEPTDSAARLDPINRLWSHARPHRLRAEEWRDALLFAAGRLSFEVGGSNHPRGLASDFGYEDISVRRSVYVPVFRNARPDLFEAFDAASPSLVTGRRDESTVATQALLLLNHPWIRDQALAVASRHASVESASPSDGLNALYLALLSRPPSQGETRIALEHLGTHPTPDDWASLAHAVCASLDFRYVR